MSSGVVGVIRSDRVRVIEADQPPPPEKESPVPEEPSKVSNPPSVDADDSSAYECNICLEEASCPVVTMCGHLYCWGCCHKWMTAKGDTATCPVCKSWLGTIDKARVIPIYAKGETEDARAAAQGVANPIPPRPAAMPMTVPPPGLDGRPIRNRWLNFLFTALDLNHTSDAPLSYEQQHQNFLSMLLLFLGSFVILCLLIL